MKFIKLCAVLLLSYGFAAVPKESKPIAKSTIQVDKVIVYKSKRELQLLFKDRVVTKYKIALGGNPKGHKEQEGDQKTPEGKYKIDWHNPNSQFYKSLHISYPNKQDKLRAKKLGVSPGGDIFIHGLPKTWASIGKAHALHDWTLGCIALTNKEITEIYNNVKDGTVIIINP